MEGQPRISSSTSKTQGCQVYSYWDHMTVQWIWGSLVLRGWLTLGIGPKLISGLELELFNGKKGHGPAPQASFWKTKVDVLSKENECQALLVCWKPWGAFWNMLPGLASPFFPRSFLKQRRAGWGAFATAGKDKTAEQGSCLGQGIPGILRLRLTTYIYIYICRCRCRYYASLFGSGETQTSPLVPLPQVCAERCRMLSDAVASDAGDGFGSTGDFLDLLLRMCTKLPHGCWPIPKKSVLCSYIQSFHAYNNMTQHP